MFSRLWSSWKWNLKWVQEIKWVHFFSETFNCFCTFLYKRVHRGEQQVSRNERLLLWKQGAPSDFFFSSSEKKKKNRLRQHFFHQQTNSTSAALHSTHSNASKKKSFEFRFRVGFKAPVEERAWKTAERASEREMRWLRACGVFTN